MAAPYVGEIRLFAGNFAPNGWAFCDGRSLAISENEVLFQLIGTTYGGDGQQTFNLPDLRGRVPIHMGITPQGATYPIGGNAGRESVTLTTQQLPSHTHSLLASTDSATSSAASGRLLAQTPSYTPYIAETASSALATNAITPTGGGQPHNNFQPYLCLNFIISLFGVFPSQQ